MEEKIKPGFAERFAHLHDRLPCLLISTVLLLALIVRIAALLSLKGSIYFDFPLLDEGIYHVWAKNIAEGTYQSLSVYEFSPLPAYIIALVYKIFSPDILYVRILNIILGVFTCYLVYRIGEEMATRPTGLFACLIAALYEPFIFYSIVPLKTSLSLFLFALITYLVVAIMNGKSIVKVFLLGIAAGLMLNVRGNFIVILPLILFVIFLYMYKGKSSLKILIAHLAVYIVGLSVAISPFMVRNYLVSGEFALTTSQSGFNFYLGNNLQNPDPYYRPVPFASSSPFEQGVQFTIEASRRTNKKLSPQEASSYWTGQVSREALEQPAAFMWKISQKALVLFNRFEAGDHYNIGFISNFVPFFTLPFFSLWLILPFGMAGMAATIIAGSRKALALCSIFFLYAFTLIAFYTSMRLRVTMLIILIPFAVMGITKVLSYIKNRQFKNIVIYSAIAAAFFVIEFLPVQGTNDMTAYYNTHAIILDSKGFGNEAIQYWEDSSRMDRPFSAFANLCLAAQYYRRGDFQKGVSYLDRIPGNSFAVASKYELIGDILVHQGQIKGAISAYKKSLEINSGQRRILLKLIRIYEKTDNKKALKENETLKYIASFYDIFR
ncbi:MAG: tetratricopeptide repeat protein [Deltaproteobacteria bacterium]|nr:tetratricopeptide repeat protein [Deltaproteobacteria bacterium]